MDHLNTNSYTDYNGNGPDEISRYVTRKGGYTYVCRSVGFFSVYRGTLSCSNAQATKFSRVQ